MSKDKVIGIVLAGSVVALCIAYYLSTVHSTHGFDVLQSHQSGDDHAYLAAFGILFAALAIILLRASNVSRRSKVTWMVLLILFFPVAALALIYRLFWFAPPRPIARSVPELVERFRQGRAGRNDPSSAPTSATSNKSIEPTQ